MAEPIVSFLVETIGKLLVEERNFLRGVSDEAEKLHSELKTMRALLKDADGKQHEAAIVQEWVSQSRNLAYEAENVLEDYAFKLASRMRKRNTLSYVRRYACILNECYIRHNVGLEIQSLNTRISDLTRRFQEYGIRAVTDQGEGSSTSARQQQLRRKTYPYVANDEDFVGFGADVTKLVDVLVGKGDSLSSHQHRGVISICAMGGSGKTTLARKVYNHPNVKRHFQRFAWVCVSQQWQTRDLLQGILVSFLPYERNEIRKWRDDEIVEQLVRIQEENMCLVVLDDIWSTEAWECINIAFPMRKKGNKIMITTRNKEVALKIGPNGYHHQLKLLSEAESLELLMKKATRDAPDPEYEDIRTLTDLGKEMVKTCGGLPLAVVILGGILATKHSSTEWSEVYKNIKSYLQKGENIEKDEGELQRILALSYSDLPYKLKPCFLYLSAFSEDEHVNVERVYDLWMAEGMVLEEDRIGRDESMKEVARRYLEQLAKRCIVMVEEKPNRFDGRYYSCHLHDLMRDLCIAKAREEHFLQVLDYGNINRNGIPELSNAVPNIPRVIIPLSDPDDSTKHASMELEASKSLRTLAFISPIPWDFIAELERSQINSCKMLKSLIIQGVKTPRLENMKDGKQVPNGVFKLPIGKLIHLRYLRLTNSELVLSPSSITNLEHLELLDLRDSMIMWTKNLPIKTKQLRHLYLHSESSPRPLAGVDRPGESNFHMQIHVSNDLEVISGLPNAFYEVKNLSELTNIKDLGEFLIRPEGRGVEDIYKCISNSRHVKQVIMRGAVLFATDSQVRELLRSNAQDIGLYGRIECKLPDYESHFLRSLLSLRLEYTKIEEDPMKILENLPNLQELDFRYDAFIGKKMVCHSMGFPRLRFLSLFYVINLETWIVEKGAMPNLVHLNVQYCSSLRMFPMELRFITSLKTLAFHGIPKQTLEEINIHNFSHVPTVSIL